MKTISAALALILFLNSLPGVVFAQILPLLEKEYFVAAGDVLSINVFPAEEFSKEVTVQPDGSIEIPLLGSVKVQGLRAGELEKLLTAKFSKYVSNPSVTINVRKFAANRVAIIGAVRAPGYREYREGMKILDLVADAHGLADYAQGDKARIFRKTKDADGKTREEVLNVDLAAVMNGQMDKNTVLLTGDIVYVPRKKYSMAAKWITDNMVPWLTLATFAFTAGILATTRR
ncbi:MAG: polysaccharide export protein [Elusimicrobia bacterium]|nr:polysaccharide export protein [Elusimicrobiota bacterium]